MLEIVGSVVVGLVGLFIIITILEMAISVVCCARGYARLVRAAGAAFKVKKMIQFAFSNAGKRYDGDSGSYYQIGGMKVSPDIRDKVHRDRFYGA